jgi:hypothetical protein
MLGVSLTQRTLKLYAADVSMRLGMGEHECLVQHDCSPKV